MYSKTNRDIDSESSDIDDYINDERDNSKKHEKAILKKILQRFSKGVPEKQVKYALLEDQDDIDRKKGMEIEIRL